LDKMDKIDKIEDALNEMNVSTYQYERIEKLRDEMRAMDDRYLTIIRDVRMDMKELKDFNLRFRGNRKRQRSNWSDDNPETSMRHRQRGQESAFGRMVAASSSITSIAASAASSSAPATVNPISFLDPEAVGGIDSDSFNRFGEEDNENAFPASSRHIDI